METLIEFMGGKDKFESRLDTMVWKPFGQFKIDCLRHIQFIPDTAVQKLSENGAGITTLMNIGYASVDYIPEHS